MASAAADTESPFERDVFTELTHRGLTAVPQVGCAGYRIDFGILDEGIPGRFLCGIECDGVAYHASETTRDRDRLRQQVLEARGWTIHRVWSTDWYKDREGQIERLISLIEQSGYGRVRRPRRSARLSCTQQPRRRGLLKRPPLRRHTRFPLLQAQRTSVRPYPLIASQSERSAMRGRNSSVHRPANCSTRSQQL